MAKEIVGQPTETPVRSDRQLPFSHRRRPNLKVESFSLASMTSSPQYSSPSPQSSPPPPQSSSSRPPPRPLSLDSCFISIRQKLDQAEQYELSSHVSIYRAPKSLRDIDEAAFAPQIVSLGPYYHGLQHLQNMQLHKYRALHHVLKRESQDVRLYLDAAGSLEEAARGFYEGPLSISADALVECLVLDSIFVLELFRGVAVKNGFAVLRYAPNDPVFTIRGTMLSLKLDMLKLENQLPLFVLDRIYAVQLGYDPSSSENVAHLALNFFRTLRPSDDPPTVDPPMDDYHTDDDSINSILSINSIVSNPGRSVAFHCLDLFRSSLLEGPNQNTRRWGFEVHTFEGFLADKRQFQFIHCVAELREAGIEFRRRKSEQFWDIEFKDGVLHIPRLIIQDGTKSLFLNLIAFEQCHLDLDWSKHITSYVLFMDKLINSEVDVGYLSSKGIIENWLGDNGEVADLFNRLGQEVEMDVNDYYLLELSKQLNCDYNNKLNVWRATLCHKYFSNPWTVISLIAAIVLLLLTFVQTFYGIYGYYNPIR